MNRRGNGLSAQEYVPLIDLAAGLADAILSALRDAGVAAYASSPEPGNAAGALTRDPLDRVYVDTSMKSIAERVLSTHLDRLQEEFDHGPASGVRPPDAGPDPGPTCEPDAGTGAVKGDDEVWAEIVASFDASPQDGSTPWPDEENIKETPDSAGQDRYGRLPTARVISSADALEPPPSDDEEHYVPPPPPPLPRGDAVTRTAWAALLGGPLYLLATVLLSWEVPGWVAFLAVAAFIGGFVALVLRMGDEPRGPDDGAVI